MITFYLGSHEINDRGGKASCAAIKLKHDHKVGIISTINIYYLLFAHLLYMHESICFNKVRL